MDAFAIHLNFSSTQDKRKMDVPAEGFRDAHVANNRVRTVFEGGELECVSVHLRPVTSVCVCVVTHSAHAHLALVQTILDLDASTKLAELLVVRLVQAVRELKFHSVFISQILSIRDSLSHLTPLNCRKTFCSISQSQSLLPWQSGRRFRSPIQVIWQSKQG